MRQMGIALGLCALSGCASLEKPVDTLNAVQQQRVERLRATAQPEARTVAVVNDGVWLAGQDPIPLRQDITLPAVFSQPALLQDAEPIGWDNLAGWITQYYGLPVQLAPEMKGLRGSTGGGSSMASAASSAGPASGPTMPTGGAMGSNSGVGAGTSEKFRVSYAGSLKGLLDTITAQQSAQWRYAKGHIEIYRMETRTFSLSALSGSTSVKNAVNNTGEGGGSGSQNISMDSQELSIWESVEKDLDSFLSKDGKVTVAQALGTVTVTDTPAVIARVDEYLKQLNRRLTRQVMFQVQIFSVSTNYKHNYALDWNLVFSQLAKNYGFGVSSSFVTPGTGGVNLAASVLTSATGAYSQWVGAGDTGDAVGSKALMQALSSQGETSLVTSANAVTLNGQPAPVNVAVRKDYLQSIKTTPNQNAAASTELVAGQLNLGFSMNLLPNVLEGDQLLLQYGLELSELLSMTTVTSGGQSVQLPEISKRNFLQRVMMRSGQTLVLAGFEQTSAQNNRSGVGSPKNWLFGGGLNNSRGREVLVVTITPRVVDREQP